eukprot:6208471-Pleurochrysis_carterae.AAC.1
MLWYAVSPRKALSAVVGSAVVKSAIVRSAVVGSTSHLHCLDSQFDVRVVGLEALPRQHHVLGAVDAGHVLGADGRLRNAELLTEGGGQRVHPRRVEHQRALGFSELPLRVPSLG